MSFEENKTQKTFSSTSLSKALPRPSLSFDALLRSKVSAVEAMWTFKVAEQDFTLQDCDHTLLFFKNMFPVAVYVDPLVCPRVNCHTFFKKAQAPFQLNGLAKVYTVQVVVLQSGLMKQLQNKR